MTLNRLETEVLTTLDQLTLAGKVPHFSVLVEEIRLTRFERDRIELRRHPLSLKQVFDFSQKTPPPLYTLLNCPNSFSIRAALTHLKKEELVAEMPMASYIATGVARSAPAFYLTKIGERQLYPQASRLARALQ